MPVTETSKRTYRDILNSGRIGEQQFVVLNSMIEGVAYSRRDLARITGLEINAVCGRVNELLKSGALIHAPVRPDPVTKRLVRPVALNTGQNQLRMFF